MSSSPIYYDDVNADENGFLQISRESNHPQEKPKRELSVTSGGVSSLCSKPSSTNRSTSRFPQRLHYFLEGVERDGTDDVIAWQPHGRCFIVKKPKDLETKLLPLWFQQSKYSSFQRQLNIYGFKRITSNGSPDKGAYYHECFLRGKPHLVQRIWRQHVKGTGPRKKSTPDLDPDFYVKSPSAQENDFSARLDCKKPAVKDEKDRDHFQMGCQQPSAQSQVSPSQPTAPIADNFLAPSTVVPLDAQSVSIRNMFHPLQPNLYGSYQIRPIHTIPVIFLQTNNNCSFPTIAGMRNRNANPLYLGINASHQNWDSITSSSLTGNDSKMTTARQYSCDSICHDKKVIGETQTGR